MMLTFISYGIVALLVVAAAVGNMASAFVLLPSSSSGTNNVKLSILSSLQAYSMYRNDDAYMETFREQNKRQIPNMPGTNPNYRLGYMESFREQDNHPIPYIPNTNPYYRRGYMETFREQNNRQIPYMPGTNPNYRRGYMESFREQNDRLLPYMQDANPLNRGSSNRNNNNTQVINGRPALVSRNNDVSRAQNDSKDDLTDSDQAWVDRELVKLCTMGRVAMENELYNTYGVAQLPPDCTQEELACYLLKARLSQPLNSTSTKNKISSYNKNKYPSYSRAKKARSRGKTVSSV